MEGTQLETSSSVLNSKRQRRPSVRLGEIGDVPVALFLENRPLKRRRKKPVAHVPPTVMEEDDGNLDVADFEEDDDPSGVDMSGFTSARVESWQQKTKPLEEVAGTSVPNEELSDEVMLENGGGDVPVDEPEPEFVEEPVGDGEAEKGSDKGGVKKKKKPAKKGKRKAGTGSSRNWRARKAAAEKAASEKKLAEASMSSDVEPEMNNNSGSQEMNIDEQQLTLTLSGSDDKPKGDGHQDDHKEENEKLISDRECEEEHHEHGNIMNGLALEDVAKENMVVRERNPLEDCMEEDNGGEPGPEQEGGGGQDVVRETNDACRNRRPEQDKSSPEVVCMEETNTDAGGVKDDDTGGRRKYEGRRTRRQEQLERNLLTGSLEEDNGGAGGRKDEPVPDAAARRRNEGRKTRRQEQEKTLLEVSLEEENGGGSDAGGRKQDGPEAGRRRNEVRRTRRQVQEKFLLEDYLDDENFGGGASDVGGATVTRKRKGGRRTKRQEQLEKTSAEDSLEGDNGGSDERTRRQEELMLVPQMRETRELQRQQAGEYESFVFPEAVRQWLEEQRLGRYTDLFEYHEVDEEVLPLLTMEDLRDMGITAVGSRRKLLHAIQSL